MHAVHPCSPFCRDPTCQSACAAAPLQGLRWLAGGAVPCTAPELLLWVSCALRSRCTSLGCLCRGPISKPAGCMHRAEGFDCACIQGCVASRVQGSSWQRGIVALTHVRLGLLRRWRCMGSASSPALARLAVWLVVGFCGEEVQQLAIGDCAALRLCCWLQALRRSNITQVW